MTGPNRLFQTPQVPFLGEVSHNAPTHKNVVAQEPAARLATLVYVATEIFNRICQMEELDFVAWREQFNQRLETLALSASDEELAWLEEHLPYEPTLKGRIGAARRKLNERLSREPALPAGAILSLFMHGTIEEDVTTLRADEVSEPTATLTLEEPLYFACHRGAIFQFSECPVIATMSVSSLPGGMGTMAQEVERFIVESEADLSCADGVVSLRYPSLNKVFPGIFNRLHLNQAPPQTRSSN